MDHHSGGDADAAGPHEPDEPDAVPSSIYFPPRIQQLVAALLTGGDAVEAAGEVGSRYAAEGEGLDVCLGDLEETLLTIQGRSAEAPIVREASLGWAETTQAHYNGLGCLDPATGLASLQHAQTQLASLYGAAANGVLTDPDIAGSRTLLLVEIPVATTRISPRFGELENALRSAAAAELLTDLVPEGAQAAQLNAHRIAAIVPRSPQLHERLGELARQLDARLSLSPSGGRCSVWTEALPDTYLAARHLLDELAR